MYIILSHAKHKMLIIVANDKNSKNNITLYISTINTINSQTHTYLQNFKINLVKNKKKLSYMHMPGQRLNMVYKYLMSIAEPCVKWQFVPKTNVAAKRPSKRNQNNNKVFEKQSSYNKIHNIMN